MSQRSAEALDAEMQQLYAAAATIEWLYEPTFSASLVCRLSGAA